MERGLPEIEADLAKVRAEKDTIIDREAKLMAERGEAIGRRNGAAIKAFDDGGTRAQICAAYDLEYEQLNTILQRAGRNEKFRLTLGMTDVQKHRFEQAVRRGIGKRAARSLVLAIS